MATKKITPKNAPVKTKAPRPLKVGDKVRVVRGSKDIGTGKITAATEQRGTWYSVNLAAARQTPDVKRFRAASLSRV